MKSHSEQAAQAIFFQHLDQCCQLIAVRIGDKQISEWTNGDYVNLSRALARKTKIRLSESTLKRIFGKSKTSGRYSPQKATRDALAQFVGYKDWEDFELRDTTHTEVELPKIVSKDFVPESRRKGQSLWLMVALFLAFAFMLTIVVYNGAWRKKEFLEVNLHCLNPEGLTPHSAIFKLEASHELDTFSSFMIDFADGRTGKKHFSSNMLNHYYEAPGRYYPKLYDKNKIIDTSFVYLQTTGWAITGSNLYDTTRVYPISTQSLKSSGDIAVTTKEALQAGVDTLKTFFIAFANIKPSEINGDNFELSFNVNTSADRAGVRCGQVDVNIYGEKDQHYFGIIKPECTVWTSYKFSENTKDGGQHDLRAFGHDFRKGVLLKLRVKDKQVSLWIKDKQVYRTEYNNSIGKVMGVNISFAGIGKFADFELRDLLTGERF